MEVIVTSYMHWLPARYISYVRSLAKNGGVLHGDALLIMHKRTSDAFLVRLALLVQSVMTFLSMFSASLDPAFPPATAFAFI